MIDITALSNTVQTNCHISDAQFAGNYSLCTFLLKMREYYRWENQIPLSEALTKAKVSNWISQRESDWEAFEDKDFQHLPIDDDFHDPFQDDSINRIINPEGLVYSGGFGLFGKPHFFLAELADKQTIEQLAVYISAKEYARDLSAPPAMVCGNNIYIRKESLRRFLWEKIEEWKWKNDPMTPMGRTVDYYKAALKTDDYETILDAMCTNETQSTIYHEIGEAKAGELLGKVWQTILAELPRSTLELKIRAVKDHLADSISTLPSLIDDDNQPALHFYFANLTGMRKEMFPEALDAYQQWLESKHTSSLKKLCDFSYNKWFSMAKTIKNIYQQQPEQWQQSIDKLLTVNE